MRTRSRFESRCGASNPTILPHRIARSPMYAGPGDSNHTFVIAVGVDDVKPEIPTRVGDRAGDR